MLNLTRPLWSASLADQNGIRFSLWDYFWCCIAGKEDCYASPSLRCPMDDQLGHNQEQV